MRIYIDTEYRCHVTDDGSLRAVETEFFDGKCEEFIEGHRLIPDGESWTRADGKVFSGEMVSAWRPYEQLDTAQRAYEKAQLADMKEALNVLGVNADG